MKVELPPADFDLSGTWLFVSQDEASYQDFTRRAQFASTRAITSLNGYSAEPRRSSSRNDLPNHLLLDMLVGLVSLPIKELYIDQSGRNLAVDYGVAGYHRFDMAEDNELLIGGAEIKATAGWKSEEMLIQMLITERFQIVQRLRRMDASNLLETLEVKMGSEQSLSHQRWYRLKTD